MTRRARALIERLRASDPVDRARIAELAGVSWADDLLARITSTDPTSDTPHQALQSAPPASRTHRPARWRPLLVASAALVIGGAAAVAALNGSIPSMFSGRVPTQRGGLPRDLRVIPSTLGHPIQIATASSTWGLWTGRTSNDEYLIDVTTQPSSSRETTISREAVGMCPPTAIGELVSVCLTRYPLGKGFVAGRAGSPVHTVDLQTTDRTIPGTVSGGYFLIPASVTLEQLMAARVVARGDDGRVVAVRPAVPGAR